MPIQKSAGGPTILTAGKPWKTIDGQETGAVRDIDFSVTGRHDPSIEFQVDLTAAAAGTTITLKAPVGATGAIDLTLPGETGSLGSSAPSAVVARISAGTQSLTSNQEAFLNYVTTSNPDSLTVGTSPWSLTAPAAGWVDISAYTEVATTSGTGTYYIAVYVGANWIDTLVRTTLTTTPVTVGGNTKIPVSQGDIVKISALCEGTGATVNNSSDASRVTALFFPS